MKKNGYLKNFWITSGYLTCTISSNTIEFPQEVVEAINSALLDLDKSSSTGNDKDESGGGKSAAEEIKAMKELLDSGAITQEEFDAKKKELLNL